MGRLKIVIALALIASVLLLANAQTKTPSSKAAQEKATTPASVPAQTPEMIPVAEADALPWRSVWLDAQLKRTEAALLNEQAARLEVEARQAVVDLASRLKIDLTIYEGRLGGADNRQLFFVKRATPTKAEPKKDSKKGFIGSQLSPQLALDSVVFEQPSCPF